MSIAVKGIYRNGRVELIGAHPEARDVEVVVTFPDETTATQDAVAREERRQRALKSLREHSYDLGGTPYPTRDKLHQRDR